MNKLDEMLRRSIVYEWNADRYDSTNAILNALSPRLYDSITAYARLRYPLRPWATKFLQNLHPDVPTDIVAAQVPETAKILIAPLPGRVHKRIHAHGELDVDLPFQALGGPAQHVKLTARVVVANFQPVVQAELYAWRGTKPVQIDLWQIPLKRAGGRWKVDAPAAAPAPRRTPGREPFPSILDPHAGSTPRATHGPFDPVRQAARTLEQWSGPAAARRYTPDAAAQRWLNSLAKRYGTLAAPPPGAPASVDFVRRAARTLQQIGGPGATVGGHGHDGATTRQWLNTQAGRYTTGAPAARHDVAGAEAVRQAARRIDVRPTAMSVMFSGTTYSDLTTRKHYQVDAFGRHVQTGPPQSAAARYSATPAMRALQARYDPVRAAAGSLRG